MKKSNTKIGPHHFFLLIALGIVVGFAFAILFLQGQTSNNSITGFATSQVGNFSAGIATYLSCTWSSPSLQVSFGSNLNPGTDDINATGNYNASYFGNGTMYNVTIDTLSNVQANITIKGENFVSGGNVIGVTNITWLSNSTAINGSNMATSQNSIVLNTSFNPNQPVGYNVAVGSTVFYRFWLDIPDGSVAGSYTGNYTQQCSQAT